MSINVFLLPDLGEGLTEAEIVRWLVSEGEEVQVDQPVVEVETAKAVVEVPTPFAGRVTGRHGHEGESLNVGAPLLSIETAPVEAATYRAEERAGSGNVLVGYGTSSGSAVGRRRRPRLAPAPPAAAATELLAASAPQASPELLAGSAPQASPELLAGSAPQASPELAPLVVSPLVRQLARERGLDVRDLRGTGAGGAVTRQDVERAGAGRPGERRIRLNGSQRSAAAAFTRSRSEIPEATIWVDVDATALVELRESGRAQAGPGLLAYLASFVVAALVEYPMFNGRLDTQRQEIVESADINLGIAVQGERGLVVPAVRDAGSMSIAELDEAIDGLVARARRGRVGAAELAAGTFTLNNYGPLGVDGSAAIINHPQVAILGVGRILDRPWVVGGELRIRKITQLSFVFDHRVADGATAAGFVRSIADAIENPVRAPASPS